MQECHFKVAELKMHSRSLVPGVVSRRVGCEVVLGMKMAEGGFGNGDVARWRLVSPRWKERQLIHRDLLKWALARCLAQRRHERTPANGVSAAVVGISVSVDKEERFLTFTSSEILRQGQSTGNTSRG